MKFLTFHRITLLITLLAIGAFCPNVRADWGSLRGSNRSGGQAQPAPRPQPQMNRQPQVRQPEIRQPQPTRQTKPTARPEQPHQEMQPARAQSRPVEHVQPEPAQIDRARAEQANRQRMDIAQERRQSYFWSDYHKGMRINRLPDGYRRFRVHDRDYFYFQGVFYDDESSGYVVVAPPVDAEIPGLPPGAETVVVGNTIYYYAAGTFYLQQPDGGYVVVAPPMGATVSLLPPDAVEAIVNGTIYYQADGTYYMPVVENGVTVYLTVPTP
jgi:Family of unknown function (DUF6515)